MSAERGMGEVDWVERYEALRAHALGTAPVAYVPLGLGVLCHRGVVTWMAEESPARPCRPEVPVREDQAERRERDPLKLELVRLLAGAALLTAGRRGR